VDLVSGSDAHVRRPCPLPRRYGRYRVLRERNALPRERTYRLQIMLNAGELAVLDAWRFERRMPSRSDAVRELLSRGLAATGDDTEAGARSVDCGVLGPPGA
jgi:hypothetical protein